MDICRGFGDWFQCLKCPHLCTKHCPLESDNVIEEMKRHMHLFNSLQDRRKKNILGDLDKY